MNLNSTSNLTTKLCEIENNQPLEENETTSNLTTKIYGTENNQTLEENETTSNLTTKICGIKNNQTLEENETKNISKEGEIFELDKNLIKKNKKFQDFFLELENHHKKNCLNHSNCLICKTFINYK